MWLHNRTTSLTIVAYHSYTVVLNASISVTFKSVGEPDLVITYSPSPERKDREDDMGLVWARHWGEIYFAYTQKRQDFNTVGRIHQSTEELQLLLLHDLSFNMDMDMSPSQETPLARDQKQMFDRSMKENYCEENESLPNNCDQRTFNCNPESKKIQCKNLEHTTLFTSLLPLTSILRSSQQASFKDDYHPCSVVCRIVQWTS